MMKSVAFLTVGTVLAEVLHPTVHLAKLSAVNKPLEAVPSASYDGMMFAGGVKQDGVSTWVARVCTHECHNPPFDSAIIVGSVQEHEKGAWGWTEVHELAVNHSKKGSITGTEDPRLDSVQGKRFILASANVELPGKSCPTGQDGSLVRRQVFAAVDPEAGASQCAIEVEEPGFDHCQSQKNWVPLVPKNSNDVFFVYSLFPFQVMSLQRSSCKARLVTGTHLRQPDTSKVRSGTRYVHGIDVEAGSIYFSVAHTPPLDYKPVLTAILVRSDTEDFELLGTSCGFTIPGLLGSAELFAYPNSILRFDAELDEAEVAFHIDDEKNVVGQLQGVKQWLQDAYSLWQSEGSFKCKDVEEVYVRMLQSSGSNSSNSSNGTTETSTTTTTTIEVCGTGESKAPAGNHVVYNLSSTTPATACNVSEFGTKVPDSCCTALGTFNMLGNTFEEFYAAAGYSTCPTLMSTPDGDLKAKMQCNADDTVTYGEHCDSNCSCSTIMTKAPGCYKANDMPGTMWFVQIDGCECMLETSTTTTIAIEDVCCDIEEYRAPAGNHVVYDLSSTTPAAECDVSEFGTKVPDSCCTAQGTFNMLGNTFEEFVAAAGYSTCPTLMSTPDGDLKAKMQCNAGTVTYGEHCDDMCNCSTIMTKAPGCYKANDMEGTMWFVQIDGCECLSASSMCTTTTTTTIEDVCCADIEEYRAPAGNHVVYDLSSTTPATECDVSEFGTKVPDSCCTALGTFNMLGNTFEEFVAAAGYSTCPTLMSTPDGDLKAKMQCNADGTVTYGEHCDDMCNCDTTMTKAPGCYKANDMEGTMWFVQIDGCECLSASSMCTTTTTTTTTIEVLETSAAATTVEPTAPPGKKIIRAEGAMTVKVSDPVAFCQDPDTEKAFNKMMESKLDGASCESECVPNTGAGSRRLQEGSVDFKYTLSIEVDAEEATPTVVTERLQTLQTVAADTSDLTTSLVEEMKTLKVEKNEAPPAWLASVEVQELKVPETLTVISETGVETTAIAPEGTTTAAATTAAATTAAATTAAATTAGTTSDDSSSGSTTSGESLVKNTDDDASMRQCRIFLASALLLPLLALTA